MNDFAIWYPHLMLRTLVVLLMTTSPTLAWQARMVDGVCELTHEDEAAQVRVTYDPAIPEYAIAITSDLGWSPSAIFAIRFDGPRGLMISTSRQVISDGGATLTVRDRGFGNVLDGLEFNDSATALLGDQAVAFALDGAEPAVRAFRACTTGVGV